MNNKSSNQIQEIESNKPWILLENGKRHYIRASAIDIILALIVPAIGPILGLVSLIKKEYKRGLTMIAIGSIQIIYIIIKSTS